MMVMGVGCVPEACEPEMVGTEAEVAMAEEVWTQTVGRMHRPLCVAEIAFVDEIPLPRGVDEASVIAGGRASRRPGGPKVRIARTRDAAAQRGTLVHELCHAMSFRHGFAKRREGIPLGGDPATRRAWREEAFALWCDLGASAPALLAELALDPVEAGMVAYLGAEVWTEPAARVDAGLEVLADGLEARLPFTIGVGDEVGITPDGALAFVSEPLGQQAVIHLDGTVELRAGDERVPLFERRAVAGPAFLPGLEGMAPDAWWIPLGDLRVGTLQIVLPTGSSLAVPVAASADLERSPVVLGEPGSDPWLSDGEALLLRYRLIGAEARDVRLDAWSVEGT